MPDSIAEMRPPSAAVSSEPAKSVSLESPPPSPKHPDMRGRATPLSNFESSEDREVKEALKKAFGEINNPGKPVEPSQNINPDSLVENLMKNADVEAKLAPTIKNETQNKPQGIVEFIKNLISRFWSWLRTP